MNWHKRYRQQADWTEALRSYIFEQIKLDQSTRMLEIGCGTGAILERMQTPTHGLDLRFASLQEAKSHAPTSPLTCANALSLPYANASFDVVFCHFLFLWLPKPQQALTEMMRITRARGHIIAFAEPDYKQRVDEPAALAELGAWQSEALEAQGADPAMGAKLTELFFKAGMQIVETGAISTSAREAFDPKGWQTEWDVLEADLAGKIPQKRIHKMKAFDLRAWHAGERVLHVPTYYLWARMGAR